MARILVRFVDAPGFVTESIDWLTNSLWPHAEIGVEDLTAATLTILSWIGAHAPKGVEERPANYCNPKRDRWYAIPCTEEQYGQVMGWLRGKIGTPYNYADIVGLAIHDRRIYETHEMICSQTVLTALEQGGIRMLNVEPGYEYLVTPEMLHLSPLLIGRLVHSFPAAS